MLTLAERRAARAARAVRRVERDRLRALRTTRRAERLIKITRQREQSRSRLVLVADRPGGAGLKALANKLSEKVGYHVFRTKPAGIRNRVAVHFRSGIDKISQFRRFHESNVAAPGYSTSVAGVASLDSKRIVARKLINASEGKGIVVFNKGEAVPPAPLYVAYINKKKEFRVHVWNNKVHDVAEKRKKRGYEQERDSYVRNTANGYVFCRTDVVEPNDLRTVALAAVSSLGRSYGAVDVIWNQKLDKCFVLEVNSRPGMEGTTVEKYATAILAEHGIVV